jgi:carboxyl-terminal processing protease
LLECGGREIRPPNDLTFSVGESASLLVEKLHGEVQKVNVQLPIPKSQKHPVTAPQAVITERLSDEIGLLRVAMFPGAIGIDVARTSTAVSPHSTGAAGSLSIYGAILAAESAGYA